MRTLLPRIQPMPIKPHPEQENTWVIDYTVKDDERMRFVQVNFVGSIKEAMNQEKVLRESPEGFGLLSTEYARSYRMTAEE